MFDSDRKDQIPVDSRGANKSNCEASRLAAQPVNPESPPDSHHVGHRRPLQFCRVGAPGSAPTHSSDQPSLDVSIRSAAGIVVAASTPITTAMQKSIQCSPDRIPETMPRDSQGTGS